MLNQPQTLSETWNYNAIPVSARRADNGGAGGVGAVRAHGAGVDGVISDARHITQVARWARQAGAAIHPTFLVIVGRGGTRLRVLHHMGQVWAVGPSTPLKDWIMNVAQPTFWSL